MSRSSSLLVLVKLCVSFLFVAESSATKGFPWRDTTEEDPIPFFLEQNYMFDFVTILSNTSFK